MSFQERCQASPDGVRICVKVRGHDGGHQDQWGEPLETPNQKPIVNQLEEKSA